MAESGLCDEWGYPLNALRAQTVRDYLSFYPIKSTESEKSILLVTLKELRRSAVDAPPEITTPGLPNSTTLTVFAERSTIHGSGSTGTDTNMPDRWEPPDWQENP